ncbi:5184_t:CDS:2 [Cetraspora pellucida]|uniref:5184_t:CDS:1 n=1 Tax=Cetraspora pellucida TaxID=1433469 RepID=A0A9N9DWC4_9GLOM|nr:5184_t:CDS:2 [Cetraspora pellucida]
MSLYHFCLRALKTTKQLTFRYKNISICENNELQQENLNEIQNWQHEYQEFENSNNFSNTDTDTEFCYSKLSNNNSTNLN